MKIVGLDLSLTSTGIADDSGTSTIRVKSRGVERLAELQDAICERCTGAALVVVEGYAYARINQAHQLGELGGVIRLGLYRLGVATVVVSPAARSKYATSKGNAPKDAVLAAAIRRLGFQGSSNDEADAWVLYCMGRAAMGISLTEVASYQREVLDKIEWPEVPRAT